MNEFLSEEIPFNDIPHDHILAVKYVKKGFRLKISEDIPAFLKWEEKEHKDDKSVLKLKNMIKLEKEN
uniref:Uncharacterized protein n=1 Tax=Rhizophagus irregularis (strain DAOM 181602 / DAOM 197198 / MUCL 43194) TaxID=747089 RepID=U9TTU5_RHIID